MKLKVLTILDTLSPTEKFFKINQKKAMDT